MKQQCNVEAKEVMVASEFGLKLRVLNKNTTAKPAPRPSVPVPRATLTAPRALSNMEQRSFYDLPDEVQCHIMSFLDKASRCHSRLTCHMLKNAVDSPEVWANVGVVRLKKAERYTKDTWTALKRRRFRNVELFTPRIHNQKALGPVLKHLHTLRSISALCSTFHVFHFQNKQKELRLPLKDISLREARVTLDTHHLTVSGMCKCVSVLRAMGKLKHVTIVHNTPVTGEHKSVAFYVDLKRQLPALKKILLLHPPIPPKDLVKNFSGRLSEPYEWQLAAEIQAALQGEVEVMARPR